jgi:putative holliday junction resolvase
MRILGIDYGTKRIGIAISDPDEQFALPHSVIKNSLSISKDTSIVDHIVSIATAEGIETIIMGESRDYHGAPNKILSDVLALKQKLEERKFIVHLEPEFMTSQQAERFQGKHDKSDAAAAALILQAYLDKKIII